MFSLARGGRCGATAAGMVSLLFTSIASAVDFANIDISFAGISFPPTVDIPAGQATVPNAALGTEGFFIDAGAVLGEYPIRIGASAADDAANGVLLGYVRENGRDVSDPAERLYATSSTVADGDPTSANTRAGFSRIHGKLRQALPPQRPFARKSKNLEFDGISS